MTAPIRDYVDTIARATTGLMLAGAPAGFLPWLAADLARAAQRRGGRLLFIAPDDLAAHQLLDTARFFAPELDRVSLPAWDSLPYDRASPSLKAASERLAGLVRLSRGASSAPCLVVTTVNAMTQRTLMPARLAALSARIEKSTSIGRDELTARLVANGYARTDTVLEAGEFALRGGIVDLYPAGSDHALRLDFFGDEIDSIRVFDPETQRTIAVADGFDLLPVSEVLLDAASIRSFRQGYVAAFGAVATSDPLYQAVSEGRRLSGMENWLPLFEDALATVFDYLGEADIVVRDQATALAADQRFAAIADYHGNRTAAMGKDAGAYRPLPSDALYLGPDEWQTWLASAGVHLATPFAVPDGQAASLDLAIRAARDFAPERASGENLYLAIAAAIERERRAGRKVVLASYSAGSRERLKSLLADHGVAPMAEANNWQEALCAAATAAAALAVLPIDHGFAAPDVVVISEQDMLGDRLVRRAKRAKKSQAFLDQLSMMQPGDLVVHADHGIGRYEGLVGIDIGRSPHDCVHLTYAGGDKLYVPVENMDVLSRYGSDRDGVVLDRLGGVGWQTRKARMKARIHEIAGELLKVAAARATRPGKVMESEAAAFGAFIDRFPYAETDDQLRAVDDVIADLASAKPMDRLVVGDVGFGKTEVALRAAFVAAMSGHQVALICPTTLLARQHAANFRERFAGLPIRIGHLSRLVPAAEAQRTRSGLADGTLDIVIGTHALLAKSVAFKRLGLVIVDEEQRFGVVHKERLKQLKSDVHVLTLTATPIPRTLQMAMSGLRDMSVIATPPVDRLAIRTYVMPWDEVVIREALLREHFRGGQSFFVTPRIADIPDIEQFLREHVPEVRFVTAHGQMSPGEVEARMGAFYDRQYEVLLSTTIIESGLDIPSANTLIVHRADMFGLAQLYQLRGRVGRSKLRAYAYLTTPAGQALTESATKRLEALSHLDTLGAGFQLAAHDLDIRGAGNLLGDEQSGHIREVGFELYQSMLEDAMLAARAEAAGIERPREAFSPQIAVDAPILIPEDFVADLGLRMGLYKRLNELESVADIEPFAAELVDRFGKLPIEVENLLKVIEIKINCRIANIDKLEAGPKGALIGFHGGHFARPAKLIDFAQRNAAIAKLRPDHKLFIQRDWSSPQQRLAGAVKIAAAMARLAA
jgi:transcription-repair coupling factor (superfamily II helicase)